MEWLYSPETITYPSAWRRIPASFSSISGASPVACSLYIRSSSGRRYSTGSTSVTACPRTPSSRTTYCATRTPTRSRRTLPRMTARLSDTWSFQPSLRCRSRVDDVKKTGGGADHASAIDKLDMAVHEAEVDALLAVVVIALGPIIDRVVGALVAIENEK